MADELSQQIFDKVKEHLLTQMQRSRRSEVGCVYRGGDGLKCAIGCLISDENYSPSLEGKGPSHKQVLRALRMSGFPATEVHLDLLDRLQKTHDFRDPDDWRADLEFIAHEFALRF